MWQRRPYLKEAKPFCMAHRLVAMFTTVQTGTYSYCLTKKGWSGKIMTM